MQEQMKVNSSILERFEFRDIRQEEADQAVLIEKICFPPNEACSEKHMKERIGVTPELFLVAVDKTTGKLAGFLNGIATDEEKFRDEFFTDASLNNPKGKKVMILGLDVLPEYRGQGLAREIVRCYLQREEEKGRKEIVLTCLDEKVEMYKRFGMIFQFWVVDMSFIISFRFLVYTLLQRIGDVYTRLVGNAEKYQILLQPSLFPLSLNQSQN